MLECSTTPTSSSQATMGIIWVSGVCHLTSVCHTVRNEMQIHTRSHTTQKLFFYSHSDLCIRKHRYTCKTYTPAHTRTHTSYTYDMQPTRSCTMYTYAAYTNTPRSALGTRKHGTDTHTLSFSHIYACCVWLCTRVVYANDWMSASLHVKMCDSFVRCFYAPSSIFL